MSVQEVNAPDTENRDQEAYRPRSAEDLEEVISRMESVSSEDEMEAVREISELVDDELRTGANSVNIHADAPIRSLNNPEENTVQLEDQEGQVVGEEYFVGQNLPGFQDVGNIKWWTVMDDDSYREETRGGGREHLQLNNEGEIHDYRVELDGEPLEGDEVQRLARNLRIRSQREVTTENSIPEHVLRYGSKEEVLENEDMSEEEYQKQLREALNHGFIDEDGDLTLKGWTVGTNLNARDLRQIDDLNHGNDIVDFQDDSFTGLDLEPAQLGARARVEFSNEYLGDFRTEAERGTIDLREEERFPEEVREFMEEYGWAGFSTDASPRERQEVSEEIRLSEYLRDIEDSAVNVEGDRLRIRNDDVSNRIFSNLHDSAIDHSDADVNVADYEVNDYDVDVELIKSGDDDPTGEEAETPEELIEEIEQIVSDSIEFESGSELKASIGYRELGGARRDQMDRLFRYDDGMTTDFSKEFSYNSVVDAVLYTRHGEEMEELNEGYDSGFGTVIPHFDDASSSLMQTVQELEEYGFIQTEEVVEEKAKVNITADELEYREVVDTLEELDEVNFTRTQRMSWLEEKNERVDLGDIRAEMEIVDGNEEEVAERLQDYRDEIIDNYLAGTEREVKDERIPQAKNFIHNELEAGGLEKLLQKVTPPVRYEDREEVMDFEDWSQYLLHPATEDMEDTTYGKNASKELLDELGEMYEEGLIDGEMKYREESDTERRREMVDLPGEARIEGYRELDEDTREELEELERQGLISIDETQYHLDIDTRGDGEGYMEPDEILNINIEGEIQSAELEMEDTPVELEGEYDTTGDTTYRANEQLREIAENLDPMNFGSRPYEEVTVETEFDYGQEVPV